VRATLVTHISANRAHRHPKGLRSEARRRASLVDVRALARAQAVLPVQRMKSWRKVSQVSELLYERLQGAPALVSPAALQLTRP
jgi:hypothetical protein